MGTIKSVLDSLNSGKLVNDIIDKEIAKKQSELMLYTCPEHNKKPVIKRINDKEYKISFCCDKLKNMIKKI